jgi:hypothetical protein
LEITAIIIPNIENIHPATYCIYEIQQLLLKNQLRKDYSSDSILPEPFWKIKKIPLLNKTIQKGKGT